MRVWVSCLPHCRAMQSRWYPRPCSLQFSLQCSLPRSLQFRLHCPVPASGIIHSSVVSANRFFVQTASGFRTVGGCSFNGYLPLWADIKSSGNFFVYEWYPGRSTPSVRWWGWTGTGWKKGWFCGDVPGWHILCYNSGIWSNYIYIYVYPRGAALSAPSGYSNAAASMTAASLPLDAPIPPDPGAERIVLPDYNLYRPVTDQSCDRADTIIPFSSSGTGLVENPAIANPALMSYPDQASYPGAASLPGQASSSRETCTTCTSSTVIAGGVSSSYPYEKSCPTCTTSASLTARLPATLRKATRPSIPCHPLADAMSTMSRAAREGWQLWQAYSVGNGCLSGPK